MGIEIERKFLVNAPTYQTLAKGVLYRQGYLCSQPGRVVRVRIVGTSGFLTIKGTKVGAAAPEYEYPIPVDDAQEMLEQLCEKPLIEKLRFQLEFQGFRWEVDEFLGENTGLVVAEIELPTAATPFPIPGWVGMEVTDDPRYFNVNLQQFPYCRWPESAKQL